MQVQGTGKSRTLFRSCIHSSEFRLKNPRYFQLMEGTVRNLSCKILLIVDGFQFSSIENISARNFLPIISVDESPNQEEKDSDALMIFPFPSKAT